VHLILGNSQVRPYLRAGVGSYIAKETSCSDVLCSTVADGGFSLGVPVGFYVFPSENVFINIGYVFNWMSKSVLDSDIGHVINLGVGFQFGM